MKTYFLSILILLFTTIFFVSCNNEILSSNKQIIKFSIYKINGTIDQPNNSIQLEVLADADIKNLIPTIEVSPKATVYPTSGLSQDFSNPVTYTVTAEDKSSVEYIVTVTVSTEVKELDIYSFTYNNKNYEICKEKKIWTDAAALAVERGGYLAEINSKAENDVIFNEIMNNASINAAQTVAIDGGGAAYLWLGGNDIEKEGEWVWDGDNSGEKVQFWQGDASGTVVGGLFTNWGFEPDNSSGQDCLGLAITEWPLNAGTLGKAGQWNDIRISNKLYFIIEYN